MPKPATPQTMNTSTVSTGWPCVNGTSAIIDASTTSCRRKVRTAPKRSTATAADDAAGNAREAEQHQRQRQLRRGQRIERQQHRPGVGEHAEDGDEIQQRAQPDPQDESLPGRGAEAREAGARGGDLLRQRQCQQRRDRDAGAGHQPDRDLPAIGEAEPRAQRHAQRIAQAHPEEGQCQRLAAALRRHDGHGDAGRHRREHRSCAHQHPARQQHRERLSRGAHHAAGREQAQRQQHGALARPARRWPAASAAPGTPWTRRTPSSPGRLPPR